MDEDGHLAKEFEKNPVLVYVYIRGGALGRINYAISRSVFDADGLTPVIDPRQQATNPEVAKTWKIVMGALTW